MKRVTYDYGPYWLVSTDYDDGRNETETIWKTSGALPPSGVPIVNQTPLGASQYQPPSGVVVSDWGAAATQAAAPAASDQTKPAGMDFYGNIINDKGEAVGQDYYRSEAWRQAQAANTGLQSAVAASAAAEASGNPGAIERASVAVTNALKTYTEAGAQISSSAPESHIDDTLTPGAVIFSEPVNALPPQILIGSAPARRLPVPLLVGGLIVLAKILL